MEQYQLTVREGGEERTLAADGTRTLLELLRRAGSGLEAPCGGHGTCHRCAVLVTGPCRGADGRVKHCTRESVLACQTVPAGDLTVEVPTAGGARILTDAAEIPGGGEGLGLAVDIGTTTLAFYLYDLSTGHCLRRAGELNGQRPYGADVISRISYCSRRPDGLQVLRDTVRGQILRAAEKLAGDPGKIRRISVAGNTVMEHIFAGLSPESIGQAPFTPLSLFGEEEPGENYGFAPGSALYLCPAVAGYVGGDITAGLLSSGACDRERNVLFIDIGTNGEMALGGRAGFLSCATAAGPAFEGAEISCGSPARDGAIAAVGRDLSYTVLGGGEAKTICGSGLLDAAAALLENGLLDETGRLDPAPYRFGQSDVTLTAGDIRQLQLAKAAIRAGTETLLERSGLSYGDVEEVLLAGGFGASLRTESACAIGLLPPAFLGRIRHVGNSAGKGAALALTEEGRARLGEIRKLCRYEELSQSALFNENYMESMLFTEWEEVLR